jgi:hypothetical protein
MNEDKLNDRIELLEHEKQMLLKQSDEYFDRMCYAEDKIKHQKKVIKRFKALLSEVFQKV